jgi:hypothetical protein
MTKISEQDWTVDRLMRCPACNAVAIVTGGQSNIRNCENCKHNVAFLYSEYDVPIVLNRTDLVVFYHLLERVYCQQHLGPVDDGEHACAHVLMAKLVEANPLERPLTQVIAYADPIHQKLAGIMGQVIAELASGKQPMAIVELGVVTQELADQKQQQTVANIDADELPRLKLEPKEMPKPDEP